MTYQTYALMRGCRIYTLQPYRTHDGRKSPFGWKYVGYCDGDRYGFFRSKKQFEEFVAREPEYRAPLGPHPEATFQPEAMSTFEGRQLLNMLSERKRTRTLSTQASTDAGWGRDGPEKEGEDAMAAKVP